MSFNDKIPVEPQKCLCTHALNGYETYNIDAFTIVVRPLWNRFDPKDERLENHCSYLVSDGNFVSTAWFDCNEFVGCEAEMLGEITHWMPFPNGPKC